MSFLGTVLNLATDSRLTGVALQPLADEVTDHKGRINWHLVPTPDADASIRLGALAAFLPSAVGGIHGNEPDGGEWLMLFQYAGPGTHTGRAAATASAGLQRALELTGTRGAAIRRGQLSATGMRRVYNEAGAGPVEDWGAVELLEGLIVELITNDLPSLVAAAHIDGGSPDDRRDQRREQIRGALAAWSRQGSP